MASFSDDFNRADSTDLGAGWVEVSGDWSIISGQLAPDTSSGTTILRAAAAMASSDNFSQFTIATTVAASQGVWCRGDNTISSGYLWRNNGSSWDLFSVVSGSFSVIGTYTAAAAPGDVAKLQAVGSTIKGFVNGIERVSVTNADVATGVNVGLRVMAVPGLRFDDFSAADVTAGATLSTSSSVETAQPLAGAKAGTLAPAAEQGQAQDLTGAKAGALGVADTVESAQPLTGGKTATLPPAVEQSTAQTVAGAKAGALGTAGSVETAQPLTQVVGVTLPTASTIETAQPLTGVKNATLAPALEVCTARPLAPQSTTVSSPERTLQVPAEHRRLVVAAEGRTLTVR